MAKQVIWHNHFRFYGECDKTQRVADRRNSPAKANSKIAKGLKFQEGQKMGCRLLEILIPAVISALLLWEGVQCKKDGYSLEVSSQVTVQVGLRVNIPCNFTYDASRDDPRAQLYGYWYMEDKQRRRPRLVATNNPDSIKEIDPRFRRRFEVSGSKLNQSDCSLTINDAEAADQATYHFRMEKGRNKYSYSAAEEKLSVIVTEKPPDVTVSGLLRAGQEARVTCIAHRSPSSGHPTITWTGIPRGENIQRVSSNRVESHVDFTPTAADHLQNVTCKATYFRVPEYMTVKRTVTLSVNYPPRKLQFSGHLTRLNGDVQHFTNFSQIVPREGDTLLVRCEVDSNPESFVGWKLRFPATRLYIYNNELNLSNMKLEDGGKYECRARNTEGYAEEGIYVHIQRQ
ncbi:UNVERIFIED_CONTAM: hypothetical protein K2H54_039745 [Gekko kuhli]